MYPLLPEAIKILLKIITVLNSHCFELVAVVQFISILILLVVRHVTSIARFEYGHTYLSPRQKKIKIVR